MRRLLNHSYIFSKGTELMLKYPDLSKRAIAERLGVSYNTFLTIMKEDGRSVKRKEKVEA